MKSESNLNHLPKLYGLDHLRALAISLVLLFHYQFFGHPAWIEPVAKFGWTGVDLFFVLSGYLISSQLFKELGKTGTISLRTFFIKRSFRILPAYWVVLAIYFILPAFHEREALPPLWRFLTFTQNIGLDLRTEGTFSHAWSLCVEEQFYLLLPSAMLLLSRNGWIRKAGALLVILIIAGFTARLLTWNLVLAPIVNRDGFNIIWYKWIYYLIYNRLDPLIAGITIAAFQHYQTAKAGQWAKYGNWFLLVGIIILAIAYYICLNEQSFSATLFGFPMVALGYGLIVFAAVSPQCVLYKTKSAITGHIAGLSFGIYLIHKGIIHLTQKAFTGIFNNDSVWMLLICIVAVLAAAMLLQVLIEKPFLDYRNALLKRSVIKKAPR